jgi:hypothetical protein
VALSNYYKTFTAKRIDQSDWEGITEVPIGRFKGFLQPVSGSENFEHFKQDEKVTHRLYTPAGVKLLYGDIITYADGLDYTVIFSLQENGISGIERHKEFLVGRRGEGE